MVESVSEFLSEKLGEYRIMSAPLERASADMAYARQLLRARVEHEIAEEVPALGALTEILDVSIIDLLTAQDRTQFMQSARTEAGMTMEEVMQQLRALSPPAADELTALGLKH